MKERIHNSYKVIIAAILILTFYIYAYPQSSLIGKHDAEVMSVAFSPDGKLLASGGADRIANIWDIQTGKLLLTFPEQNAEVESVAFSPNSEIVIIK